MAFTEIQGADASPVAIPAIQTESLDKPFTAALSGELAKLLPAYLTARRWFRSKARPIKEVIVEDVVPFSAANRLFVLTVSYEDGGTDNYLLPLSLALSPEDSLRNTPSSEPLAVLRDKNGGERLLFSAFANPSFRASIFSAFAANEEFKGQNGTFVPRLTAGSGVAASELDPSMESSVSRAEQSNTSVVYGNKFILKLFRKIEAGVNPDVEVGVFLTEHGFANTPAVVGTLEYRRRDEAYAAGLLGAFVPNRGDAWKYTLDELGAFFESALQAGSAPEALPYIHPLELATALVPETARKLLGRYLPSAALLGKRTAEMHTVLAKGNSPDFAPAHARTSDLAELRSEMDRQTDTAFSLLRARASGLPAQAAGEADELLGRENDVRQRFGKLQNLAPQAARIRFHGDYHLGQVLYTGADFMIIDFEGEPARPLDQRREKTFALRDVAGMVRSFHYAAYVALFGQVGSVDVGRFDTESIARWSRYWYGWAAAAFLKGYFDTANGGVFLGPDPAEHRVLLDAFLLHKALYEVAYEINNRPDWVRIPLRGILDLIA